MPSSKGKAEDVGFAATPGEPPVEDRHFPAVHDRQAQHGVFPLTRRGQMQQTNQPPPEGAAGYSAGRKP